MSTLNTALAAFDAATKACPFSKSPHPPADKPCPKCAAQRNEACRREAMAAFDVVAAVRDEIARRDSDGTATAAANGDLPEKRDD